MKYPVFPKELDSSLRIYSYKQPVDQAMVDTFKQIVTENGIEYISEQANIDAFLKMLNPEFRFVHDFNIIGPFDCPKAEDSGLPTHLGGLSFESQGAFTTQR